MANPTRTPPVNNVPAELNLARILDITLQAFVVALLPLRAVSTVISGEILVGTKKVEVPYVPAETAASLDFNAANGDCYDTGTTNRDKKEVSVDRRKYQPWGLTSEDALNNSFLANQNYARQKGQKLAADVLSDILAPLADPTIYTHEKIIGLPAVFDADDALDIREACNGYHMPRSGRSLILEDSYETNLLKYLKPVSVSGDGSALRDALVNRIAGFDEYATEIMPTANNLVGLALFPSALLVAMRPLEPLPAVKQALTDYQVLTDPETGITLTYREWPDPGCDRVNRIVECNYGRAVGEAAAALRLISAARA